MARPEMPSQIDVLVQQKARRAPEVCRGRSVEQQRMHEDDIACRRSVFQHLQRDAADLLNAFVEPFDAGSGLAGGAEVPQVRMAMDRCPELGSSGPRPRRMIEKPPMDQPMRAADDIHPTGSRCNIAEHRVDLHALGW
jgi:hypothetical protein